MAVSQPVGTPTADLVPPGAGRVIVDTTTLVVLGGLVSAQLLP